MSLDVLAQNLASRGRNGDTMLVHMTPGEVHGLHALALAHGGQLTINPETGLPEANFLKKLLPMVAGAALNFFAPGIGTAIGGALGLGGAAGSAIAVGGITGLATGSLQKGLMAGLGAYGGAGLAEGLSALGTQEAASKLAEQGIAAGAQENARDALLARLGQETAIPTGLEAAKAGLAQAAKDPRSLIASLGGGKQALQYAAMAAAPIMADAMVPTTTGMPGSKPGDTGYRRSFVDFDLATFGQGPQGIRALEPVPANQIRYEAPPPGGANGGLVALASGGNTNRYTYGDVTLPPDWYDRGAKEKIDFFNQYGITPAQIKAADPNTTDADIQSWRTYMGYTAGAPAPAPAVSLPDWAINPSNPNFVGPQAPASAQAASDSEWFRQSQRQEFFDAVRENNPSVYSAVYASGMTPEERASEDANEAGRRAVQEGIDRANDPAWQIANYGYVFRPKSHNLAPGGANGGLVAFASGGITLPSDIGTYTADQKADLYNSYLAQGIGDAAIRQAAGTQSDADWSYLQNLAAQRGSPAPAPAPDQVFSAPVAAPAPAPAPLYTTLTSGSSAGDIAAAYNDFISGRGGDTQANQAEAINYLQSIGITPGTIDTAYDAYRQSYATPAPAPALESYYTPPAPAPYEPAPVSAYQAAQQFSEPVAASAAAPAAAPAQQFTYGDVTLPPNWYKLDAADKINFFNEKKITPQQLVQSGVVSRDDLNWMMQHGYKAPSEFGSTISGSEYHVLKDKDWRSQSGLAGIAGLNANINQWVAENPNATYTQIQDAANQWGVDVEDIKRAITASGGSGALQYVTTSGDFKARSGETGLAGLGSNINRWIAENPNATRAQVYDEMAKWQLNQADIKRATGKTVEELYPLRPTPAPTVRVPPVIDTGTRPGYTGKDVTYGGTDTLNQVTPAQLGTAGKITRGTETLADVRAAVGNRYAPQQFRPFTPSVTGASKAAYDYLMGRGAYPTNQTMPGGAPLWKPYVEAVGATAPGAFPRLRSSTADTTGTGVPFGFKPPSTGGFTTGTQRWRNTSTGEVYLAPTGGFTPPSNDWVLDEAASSNPSMDGGGEGVGGLGSPSSDGFGPGEAAKAGGLMKLAMGGYAQGGYNLGSYSDGGRLLRGPGDGVSDSIPATIGRGQPARLADGEFVIPARIVSELGNGSTEAGARKLYAMMARVQRARRKTTGKNKVAVNTKADRLLPA